MSRSSSSLISILLKQSPRSPGALAKILQAPCRVPTVPNATTLEIGRTDCLSPGFAATRGGKTPLVPSVQAVDAAHTSARAEWEKTGNSQLREPRQLPAGIFEKQPFRAHQITVPTSPGSFRPCRLKWLSPWLLGSVSFSNLGRFFSCSIHLPQALSEVRASRPPAGGGSVPRHRAMFEPQMSVSLS